MRIINKTAENISNGILTIGYVGESAATGHTAHTLGQYDGEETHVLTTAELASHNHSNPSFNSGISGTSSYGTHSFLLKADYRPNFAAIGGNYNGSNTAHNTMPPYTGINFIIYTGIEDLMDNGGNEEDGDSGL